MSKIRLKQIDQVEVSGYILDVTTGIFSGLNSSLTGCIYTGNTLSGAFGSLFNSFSGISGQFSTFSGELYTVQQEFDSFDADLITVSGQVYGISGMMNSISGDLVFFSGLVDSLQADVTSLSNSLNVTSGKVNTLSGNVNSISGNLQSEIDIVSGLNITLSGHLVTTSGKVNTLSGHVVTTSGNANTANTAINTFSGRYVNDYILLCDASGSGVAGGTFTAGAWRTRNLNTEVIDSGNICSISSNRIILSGGVYRCDISSPALRVGTHISRLRNISDSTTLLTGSAEYSSSTADYVQSKSRIVGQFSITGTTGQLLEIQHICTNTYATFGFGGAFTGIADNVPNIYTTAEFTRILA